MKFGLTKLENFERAMLTGHGSCCMTCACGKIFYEPRGPWTWDEGEREELAENPNAKSLDYCPSQISFEGREFADACDCWHPRAQQIIRFLDGHSYQFVKYLKLEKDRKTAEADASPVFEEPAEKGGA